MSEASEQALRVALEAARVAGEIQLSHLGRLDPARLKTKSARRDLVTQADLESEASILAALRTAFPEHAIESEEAGVDDGDPNRGPRWFVDPLDGTNNFVHQLPAFAVSMALWVDGQPEVAVVHAPRLGETFHATRGGGAWLHEEPLRASTQTELADALLATGFPYRRGELEHDNLANFGALFYEARGLRRMGSAAIDLAYVAAGRFDAFWELHLSPHDVAAGGLLVREAGGLVSDADGGEDWLRGGHLVAGSEALCTRIRDLIRH